MAGVRRTWDKEYYEAKAKERIERGDVDEIEVKKADTKSKKEEFVPASEGAEGPAGSARAFLNARKSKIDLESKVGKTQVIAPSAVESAGGAGWWCEVCTCLLKDSTSYLDHINGKKHQRALGFSMRVERADVNKVKDRFKTIKRNLDTKKTKIVTDAFTEYDSRLTDYAFDEERRKKQKKEEILARKAEREQAELETVDPEIASLLGFGGFGTSKK